MSLAGRRVLVTGGSGFIGSHIVSALLNEGAQVRILDSRKAKFDYSNSAVEEISGDITDSSVLTSALSGIDAVIHLAALVSVQGSIENPALNEEVNNTAVKRLLQACSQAGVSGMVFASSAAIYGDPIHLPIAEDHPLNPMSPYGEAKSSADLLVRESSTTPACALRLFNVFGPGQSDNSPYSGVVALFRRKSLAGQDLTVFGDGGATRDFVHVSDVGSAFLLAVESLLEEGSSSAISGMAFNVCTGVATSILQVAQLCSELAGNENEIHFAEARSGDIEHSVGDSTALGQALGWKPKVSFAEGIAELMQTHL